MAARQAIWVRFLMNFFDETASAHNLENSSVEAGLNATIYSKSEAME
jgi:hypothetical protein